MEHEEDALKPKKSKRGRPRREVTDEKAFREVMLEQTRAQTKALRAMQGMTAQVGGHRPKQVMIGRYFLAMSGLPGADALEVEVNRLLGEWTSQGWYPVGHVTSQPGNLETVEGGQLRGDVITILWGHD